MNLRFASAAVLGAWLCSAGLASSAFAQALTPAQGEERPEGEVLTRGPVHEAFAEPITFDAKPGMIVPKQPPEAIEEIPPDQKPEGENVAWISGYWTWDDERKDFIWASGLYRVLPHGRQWVAGYWTKVPTGFQWVSGFWSAVGEVEYYPQPPESLEVGPSSDPPTTNHLWIPGAWRWRETRYAWQPGYWYVAQPDWVWVPAHYLWTPYGFAFVDGYWDYVPARRGLLFAPVYFEPAIYGRPRFAYSPSVVVSVNLLSDHFFCRPHYHHYYFGDYYAASYVDIGIVPWFSFHLSRRGYCPVYAHHHWHEVYHDHHADWAISLRASYEHRRDHVDARPPRTLVAQQTVINNIQKNVTVNKNVSIQQVTLAQPLSQVAQQKDSPLKLERLDRQRHEQVQQRAKAERQFRKERVRLESSEGLSQSKTRDARPRKVELKSPVVARTAPAGDDDPSRVTPRTRPGLTLPKGPGDVPKVKSDDTPRPKSVRPGGPVKTNDDTSPKSDNTPRLRAKTDTSPPKPRSSDPPPKKETRPKLETPPKPKTESPPPPHKSPQTESSPPTPRRVETPPQRNADPPRLRRNADVQPAPLRRSDPAPAARRQPSPPPSASRSESPRTSRPSDSSSDRGSRKDKKDQ